MLKIVFATSNKYKLKELNAIARSYGVSDVEFVLPPEGFDPVEDGQSFEENSLIKAREAAKLTGLPALADDSGLCVECLDGAPGIYSARYAETPGKRIDKLLAAVAPYENRKAKFVCVMTLTNGNGDIIFSGRGECVGKISDHKAGTGGFGYDPVFLVDGKNGLTMAELSDDEKNQISHRSAALRTVLNFIFANIHIFKKNVRN